MLTKPAAVLCRLMLLASVGLTAASFLAVGLQFNGLLYLAAAAAAVKAARHGAGLWTHGTSRVASWSRDLLRRGLLGDRGIIMGRVGSAAEKPSLGQAVRALFDPRVASPLACRMFTAGLYRSRWAAERMIRIRDFVHVCTVAPAGAGKSTRVLVPNLLSYRGSLVICDPKGELAALTLTARRRRMRHRCYVFDPFGILKDHGFGRASAFNPLDAIDATSPDFLSKCRDLANMLVVRTGEEREPHWNDSAEIILTAIIAFVCACEPDKRLRTLRTVRRIVSSSARFGKSLKTMQQVEGFWGIIADHGRICQWFIDRELGSVMTTVQRHTEWMDDPQISECLSTTTFDPRLLRTGRVSVYLVLPGDKLSILQSLMRTWLGSFMRIATQGVPTEKNPVLFLVDEAGHVGYMRALQDGITLMRGYGIRIWLFFQSLSQLHECYGKHASIILSNLGTQQFFGINDLPTAEAISNRIGPGTILVDTDTGGGSESWPSGSGGREQSSGTRGSSWSRAVAPQGRAVLMPSEILVMPEDEAVVFHRNLPPIIAHTFTYFEAKEFRNGGMGVQPMMGLGTVLASAATLLVAVVVAAGALGGTAQSTRQGLPRPDAAPGAGPYLSGGYLPPPPVRGGSYPSPYDDLPPPPPPPMPKRSPRLDYHPGVLPR